MSTATYEQHFGLGANPFAAEPDPHFLYMSPQHKEALAHLLYGVGTEGGVVVLTGDIGAGKTTVCRCLLQELPGHVDVARIAEPGADAEMLFSVCRGFGIETEPSAGARQQIERLNAFLVHNHALGRQSVLIVDEAQRLNVDMLEQLRLLTNLETNERKLLQIVLIGQPDLRELLARPELRQLSQRIVARYHLRPLARRDMAAYVHHRLAMAGGRAQLVPARLARRLHALSRGIPRTLNQLCDRALLGASVRGQSSVDRKGLARAAHEIGVANATQPWPWDYLLATLAFVATTVCAAVVIIVGDRSAIPTPSTSSAMPLARADQAILPMASGSSEATRPAAMPASAAASALALAQPEPATRDTPADQAYVTLLQRWAVAPQASTWQGCSAPRPDGLRCLRGRAGLDELRALNLPAVLHLKNDQGRRVDALLQTLQGETVSLRIAGVDQRLNLNELAARWHGDFTLLWRAPPAYEGALSLGSRGPAVAWLRSRIAQLLGEAIPATPEKPFDATLLAKVREFQLREGLDPDGAAGMKTLTRLAARTDPALPSLTLRDGHS